MKYLKSGWFCGNLFLGLCLIFAFLPKELDAAEQTLPLLTTRNGTYTNVTVTTKRKDYVFILHSAGMANIRIQDLSPEAQEELGYTTPEKKKNGAQVVLAKELMPAVESKLKPFEASMRERIHYDPKLLQPTRNALMIAAGILVAFHLFFSYCCHLITLKSRKQPTLLAWIPWLQWIPLFRAAEMSGWWFLVMFLPFVPVMWAFKIAKARGMSVLVAICLILPVTNFFAFLYLAFAKEASQNDGEKYQSMSLQTA